MPVPDVLPDVLYDVVVVGVGPVGATAANLLGAMGYRVIALDRAVGVAPLPRAIHLDDEAMRLFQRLGLAERVAADTGTADAYEFLDGAGRLLFSVDRDRRRQPEGWPRLNMFRQPRLERVLRDGLARYPAVTVQTGTTVEWVTQDGVGVTIGGQRADGTAWRAQARYVLACDGAGSTVRRLLDVPLQPAVRRGLGVLASPEQRWLVVDTALLRDVELPDRLRQVCDPVGSSRVDLQACKLEYSIVSPK